MKSQIGCIKVPLRDCRMSYWEMLRISEAKRGLPSYGHWRVSVRWVELL